MVDGAFVVLGRGHRPVQAEPDDQHGDRLGGAGEVLLDQQAGQGSDDDQDDLLGLLCRPDHRWAQWVAWELHQADYNRPEMATQRYDGV